MQAYLISRTWKGKLVRSTVEVYTDLRMASSRFKELGWYPKPSGPKKRPKGMPRPDYEALKKQLEKTKEFPWVFYLLDLDQPSSDGNPNMKAVTEKWLRENLL